MDESVVRLEINGAIWWEYHTKRYPEICRQGNACAQIANTAERYCQGNGLDIGAGAFPFREAFPVRDTVNYFYRDGKQCKRPQPYPGGNNAYNLGCFVDGSMDYIFSSHCLEHLDRPADALREWIKKLKVGGVLFLYLPHPSMELWRMGSPWVGKAHKWVPEIAEVNRMVRKAGCEIINGKEGPDAFYSFWTVGRKK